MSDSDQFDKAIEKLLADQSPRSELFGLDQDEQRMVQMAQLLRGSRDEGPAPGFVERLHATVLPQPVRVSRRAAFLSGLGALAAGLLAGIGLDRAARNDGDEEQPPLVGANGKWIPVATLADVPNGSIKTFTVGAVQGFLVNRNGDLKALSRICTHMGCTLNFQRKDQAFLCPCHGAEFDLRGRYIPRNPKYSHSLPPLPELKVRVNDQSVEVWGV